MKNMMKGAIFALASLMAMSSATTASAQSGPALSAKVVHEDLDLSTDRGQKILQWRFRQAVRQVCPDHLVVDLKTRSQQWKCQKVAEKSAEVHIAALIKKQQLAAR